MYISELKLWNFRKYGADDFDLTKPHLTVPFKSGMNVLIGENDSGKTAIIDAIKYVLKTNAYESIRILQDDFYNDKDHLRIELLIDDVTDDEAKNFTELTDPKKNGGLASMKLILDVVRKDGHIQAYEVRGGFDADGHSLTPNGEKHDLIKIIEEANAKIEKWFDDDTGGETSHKRQIKGVIDQFVKLFISDDAESQFLLADPSMKNILERLAISVVNSKNLGLGTLNRLFMATELLHLKKKGDNLKVCLIEELEAHIHPQAQMKVISALQKEESVQFILTTHSPNITSKVKLGKDTDVNSILICNSDNVFPMGAGYTKLEKKDYKFLDTFLDVTKSNLFFAKGVILVEGWAEEILIPVIASKMGLDLTQHEISVVNVGSTAYLHFARVFMRRSEPEMKVKCAIVTDLDVRPDTENKAQKESEKKEAVEHNLGMPLPTNVGLYLAKEWTLEWCLFKSPILSDLFKDSVAEVHSRTEEFKKDAVTLQYTESFETKLKEKLIDRSLEKTDIALVLSEKIKTNDLNFAQQDLYIKYLLDAIGFVAL